MEEKSMRELTDRELDQVSGGGFWGSFNNNFSHNGGNTQTSNITQSNTANHSWVWGSINQTNNASVEQTMIVV
jgi:bacteriocin-like protein